MQLLEQKKHQNKPSECIFINVMVVVRTQMHYDVHCCLLQYHWLIVVCYTHKHKNPHIVNAIVRSHYLSAYSLTYSGYWCIYYTYKTFIHLRINPVSGPWLKVPMLQMHCDVHCCLLQWNFRHWVVVVCYIPKTQHRGSTHNDCNRWIRWTTKTISLSAYSLTQWVYLLHT